MKFGFLWITLALFLITLVGHWTAGWFEYVQEQKDHHAEIEIQQYLVVMARGTLENWQSELLQLCWQVGGLAYFLYVGSPQSKEGDERKEELMEAILRSVNPKEAEDILQGLEAKYPKK